MSDKAPVPPTSRYIPAREEWLKGWCGPALAPTEHGDYDCVVVHGTDGGRAYWYNIDGDRSDFGDGEGLLLNPANPEVRHLVADRLGLGMEYRAGKWAAGLCWWAGVTGLALANVWTKGEELDIGGQCWCYYTDRASTVADSDAQIIGESCALINEVDGRLVLILPPVEPGGAPILWSDHE